MLVDIKSKFDGTQELYRFDNNYGASVLRNKYSYGGDEGLYEVGVIKWEGDAYDLTYETPVTDDVLGYLTRDEVDDTLKQIALLTGEGVQDFEDHKYLTGRIKDVKNFLNEHEVSADVKTVLLTSLEEVKQLVLGEEA